VAAPPCRRRLAEKLRLKTGLEYAEGLRAVVRHHATHMKSLPCAQTAVPGVPIIGCGFTGDQPLTPSKEVGPDVTGEIIVQGEQLFQVTCGNGRKPPRKPLSRLGRPNAFLPHGDLGYYDEEGYFYLVAPESSA